LADQVPSGAWVDNFLAKVSGIVTDCFGLRKRLAKKSVEIASHLYFPYQQTDWRGHKCKSRGDSKTRDKEVESDGQRNEFDLAAKQQPNKCIIERTFHVEL
jgi:hypothetical protein